MLPPISQTPARSQALHIMSVGLLFLPGLSPALRHERQPAPVRETADSRAHLFAGEAASPEAGAEDYKQLRAEALANAEMHLTSRLKNPRLSHHGFGSGVLSALDEQWVHRETELSLPARSRALDRGTGSPAVCDGPAIRAVNGSRQGVMFTPQASGNFYKIEGCSFGNVRGRVQLEPHSPASGQTSLPIVFEFDRSGIPWSDREINVHLDPHLSGIPDSPVTLVIYAGNGKRIELPGGFFVAVRGAPQLLRVIPASWVTLHASTVRSRSIQQLEYVSPPVGRGDAPRDASGTSALVVRSDSEPFATGGDTYDFSHLGPGWAVDSVQLQTYAISCPVGISYVQPFGRWDVTWGQQGFTISWEGNFCKSYALPLFNFNLSFSQYAAKVWVIGPVGTRPMPDGLAR